jgi:hypothetical protein
VVENATILVSEGRILEVATGKVRVPAGFTVIDGKGKFAMPGLWDMHVHYMGQIDGLLYLACGVTNVRDMGNEESLLDRKREFYAGSSLAPSIQVMAGFIDGNGPFAEPVGTRIDSVRSGVEAIHRYHALGYTQIKLYSSLKPKWVRPLAEESSRLGMRVGGHVLAHMFAEEAVR